MPEPIKYEFSSVALNSDAYLPGEQETPATLFLYGGGFGRDRKWLLVELTEVELGQLAFQAGRLLMLLAEKRRDAR